jgi:hypothetical protein
MTLIFFVVSIPLIGVLAIVTQIFVGTHYHTIVTSTANGGRTINWTGDTFVDMIGRAPYVLWLLLCSTAPAMIVAGMLVKQFGAASFLLPLGMLWLIFPVVQLSSLYSSSVWMPFNPVALAKMAGKPAATMIFFALSGLAAIAFGIGCWLCFMPTVLRVGGLFLGAAVMAAAVFAYARLVGRLAFSCSFVGVKEETIDETLPSYSADNQAPKATKKKVKRSKVNTDGDDGGYGLAAEEPPPAAPEPEKEFVPPKFAWDTDDDDATPYTALQPDVDIKQVVTPRTFEVKASELKLLRSADDQVTEPRETWTPEVLTDFLAVKETWSQMAIAMAIFAIDGLTWYVVRSFL